MSQTKVRLCCDPGQVYQSMTSRSDLAITHPAMWSLPTYPLSNTLMTQEGAYYQSDFCQAKPFHPGFYRSWWFNHNMQYSTVLNGKCGHFRSLSSSFACALLSCRKLGVNWIVELYRSNLYNSTNSTNSTNSEGQNWRARLVGRSKIAWTQWEKAVHKDSLKENPQAPSWSEKCWKD